MTATAPGRVLRCDTAGCTAPGTVEVDAWAFCTQHAGRAKTDAAALSVVPRKLEETTVVLQQKPASTPAAPSPLGQLLEQASAHSSGKIRRLGERIEAQLDGLRSLIAEAAEDERRKQLDAETKRKAAADVARLTEQLAAAKALLKPASAKRADPSKTRACDQCGKPSKEPGKRGAWPRTCAACKAGAA